ncbi:MAG: hypothetical protein HY543_10490 [Deltaproteobacteria bacterium]|nr:hypothetical protein [Deltaproteobacteria bacterium]
MSKREIRSAKLEINPRRQFPNSKTLGILDFGFEICFGFGASDFVFRISEREWI